MSSLLRTLRALVVRKEWADEVVSGPYDAYSPSERRSISASKPHNFLNVTRSPEDLVDEEPESNLIASAAEALTRILDAGAYGPHDECIFLYELSWHDHTQLGVVGLVQADALTDGRIRKHEEFRPNRANLLANHFLATGATSSPISLSFRSNDTIESLLRSAADGDPVLDHVQDGVGQRVWAVSGEAAAAIVAALDDQTLYITDGHHRAAAATQARRIDGTDPSDPELDWALAALFPDRQLRVLAFHRRVYDRAERTYADLVADIEAAGFVLDPAGSPDEAAPTEAGEIGLYIGHHWYRSTLRPSTGRRALDQLDVQRLQSQLLGPVFGVTNPGDDPALDYVSAAAGIDHFVQRCDEDGRVGLLVFRTPVDALFDVADDGDLMPPKSSYFAPKPRSGVFLRPIGRGSTEQIPPSLR